MTGTGTGKGNLRATRVHTMATRMLGMYRLMDEQFGTERSNLLLNYAASSLSRNSWRRFVYHVRKTLDERLTGEKAMKKFKEDRARKKGTAKELLWGQENHFPEQALAIRVGHIMESAISEFLNDKYGSAWAQSLQFPLSRFANKNIQLDVAVAKGKQLIVGEIKYNFDLDTEKADSVVSKLDLLNVFLKDHLKDVKETITPHVCFINLSFPTANSIPKLKPVFESIKENYIVGYQEFFNFFGMHVTERMWVNLHKEIGREIMRSYNAN
jgi:hypothetical protein